MVTAPSVSRPWAQRVCTATFLSPDHQSIYIGVPVPRGYRRKRRRRRSSREASDVDRSRRYSHHRHHEDGHYRDMDVEEGLTDSNEQSLQDLNHTGESGDLRSPFSPPLSFRLRSGHLSVQMLMVKKWNYWDPEVFSSANCFTRAWGHFEGQFNFSYYSFYP